MNRYISYYDLMIQEQHNIQPPEILVSVDEGKELLFEYNKEYNTYYVVSTNATESFYDGYLYEHIDEEMIYRKNIKVVTPYQFKIGDYVSYFDLMTAIQFDIQPYRVRIHFEDQNHDYIYKSLDSTDTRQYYEYEDDGSLPPWSSRLIGEVADNWFKKNIEVIEAGNSLI